jgi:RimJ/RimL family protein N-acetyltransferase
VTAEALARAIASRIADPQALRRESLRGPMLVDGSGVTRVADEMMSRPGLRLRPAVGGDEALLLAWANDPEVRRWAFHPEPIAAPTHREWLRARLADRQVRLWILVEAGIAKGQLRCEHIEGAVRVNYSIATEWRGAGLGRAMLLMGVGQCRSLWPDAALKAEVMEGNVGSERALKAAGFIATATTPGRRGFMRVHGE